MIPEVVISVAEATLTTLTLLIALVVIMGVILSGISMLWKVVASRSVRPRGKR